MSDTGLQSEGGTSDSASAKGVNGKEAGKPADAATLSDAPKVGDAPTGNIERTVLKVPPPGTTTDGVPGILRTIAKSTMEFVDWVLTRFASPTVLSAMIALLAYTYTHRDAVRVLAFEGAKDGTALAVQLGQMLDAVDRGARTGVDEGLEAFACTTTKPPEVALPGVGISLTSLLSWGETQIQGQLIDKGSLHQVRLTVTGRVSGLVETDFKPTVDDALVDGAERLYAIIVPVNGAYYYFSRYPDRALEILQRLLDTGHPTTSVYRAWGLALRNLGDTDGALEVLGKADALATTPTEHAHLHVEMGYVARAAKRWDAAVEYFDKATAEDPKWPVPVARKADALRESGKLSDALGAYEHAGTMKASFADAWVGIGRVHSAAGRDDLALVAYETARRFAFDRHQRASLLRDIGDVLFELGCIDEAANRYTAAIAVVPTYDGERAKLQGRACPGASVAGRGEAPGCAAYEPVPAVS